MIDFAALPPEVNSARMYSGPGSASMLAAASAWNGLAAELRSAAASYGSAVKGLTSEGWSGPSSASMSAAVAPYLEWLSTTAAQAEQTGTQANAAAAAYESAFAATVPPSEVAANRAQLSNLVATNIIGQNTAAIAATEAQYAEMWAQDAAAMNGYAGASSAATQLTPFASPASTTSTDGVAGQANAVAQAASSSTASTPFNLADWLGIAPNSNTSTTGLAGVMNFLDGSDGGLFGAFLNNPAVANTSNGITSSGLFNPTAMIDSATAYNFLYAPDKAAAGASGAAGAAAGAASGAAAKATGSVGAAAAGIGQANLVGSLSVPPAWGASGATITPATLATTHIGAGAYQGLGAATPMVTEEVGPMGMPGVPVGGIAGAGDDEFSSPVYGFRLRVLGRPPAVG